ncbi:P-loop containing nucleoside triphosphate hydrolase protein [Schizophyllum commune H4-8]|uniref:P-loop containing nucleoside triphosphate hydrolase protein n=1 Tax=Schizophyllum commune (strain H4-8 / FGSC 9210) TaxID=578458 RepID=D8PQZ9_SCHCM|nr:P-loop containing nucleoside triphosphate hydrolase protein [Schizophyllum commune H4-8]KAI5893710.1 P-loop containing nucleoside triphosphate hydrolase protein [Schizophyllum commune H4-8]
MKTRVILVGVGGATCSGKTTLAKHLKRIIPNSVIIHQDVRISPPAQLIPIHPKYGVQDWDWPDGAIDWARMIRFLKEVKQTGRIPDDHYSHDHLNEQKDVPIPEEVRARWTQQFQELAERESRQGEQLVWGLVDGFLLYWHPEVFEQLDIRFFLRVPEETLKKRRHERHGYHTAEGALWRDPPHYWEQIVYPAYVEAHKHIFEGGDVEHGRVSRDDIVIINALEESMGGIVERCSHDLVSYVEKAH